MALQRLPYLLVVYPDLVLENFKIDGLQGYSAASCVTAVLNMTCDDQVLLRYMFQYPKTQLLGY